MPRFLTMVRVDENDIPAGGVSEGLMRRMGELIEEMTKAGVLLETGGLTPTSEATRVTWSNGRISYTDGPFTETKEVIGGFALIQAKDRAEALEWTKRFLQVHEEYWTITSEIREITEG
ncbi:transcriptional regulator [Streptomyces inusitatus]|uniref:Transcriptional regulator n=1 Tax=Streptomyces inusitatus TaxID=68221 RepID=A0A918ULX4_9ACTN|nr:YciI family protein [Streptomyces inusitatus]GGZ19486.1 transcriptional regulator [Streptomyces inusitatus]